MQAMSRDASSIPTVVDDLAKQCLRTEAAGHVQALLTAAEGAGIVYEMTINSQHVLTAPCNRNGDGVETWDVQENVSDITVTKFHQDLFKGLITDIRPEDFDHVLEFNQKIASQAQGLLAKPEPRKASHMTLWGGHTTQGFRAVQAKCAHWDADLCVDGFLDLHRVACIDPDYAAAVRNGATYRVIPSWFLINYPGLDVIVQAAGNILQNVAKPENDLQMLRKLHGKIVQGHSFDDIKNAFLRSRPKNIGALPHMFNFIRKFPRADLLNLTIQFCKSKGGQIKQVNGDVFDAIQTDFKGLDQAEFIKFGMLGAVYADKSTTGIGCGIIKTLGSKEAIDATRSANLELKEMFDLMKGNPTTNGSLQSWLAWSQLAANVSCMLASKNTSDVETILDGAGQPRDYLLHTGHLQLLFISAVKEACGVELTGKFNDFAIPKKDKQQKRIQASNQLITRNEDDATTSMMLELGFKVGSNIMTTKKTATESEKKAIFSIEKIHNGNVSLINTVLRKPVPQVNIAEFQDKQWRVVVAAKVDDILTYKEEYSQHELTSYMLNVVKGACLHKVYMAQNEETLESGGVDAATRSKSVTAKVSFKVGELVLAPNSHAVAVQQIKSKADVPPRYDRKGLLLGVVTINKKLHAVTAASMPVHVKDEQCRVAKDTMLIPFWSIETSAMEASANMKLYEDTSKTNIKMDALEEVKVPLMKNFKAVAPGDELILYAPWAKSADGPILKKQKTMTA
jgi:hypothetical protein